MAMTTRLLTILVCSVLLATTASARTLKVGPNEQLLKPSDAFKSAADGDTIEISQGNYAGDVATIRGNKLTIRGIGKDRIKIPAAGRNEGGKGIWITAGSDTTIENIEFSGARVRDHNGAGIRAQGPNLKIRNCRFHDCENGILGGAGEILVEYCEFDHCGHNANPATHSIYISARCTKLTFQFNYSTHTLEGHLLKTRAKESWILYNRLTDETGMGSAVADFPNGGYVVMIGNLMHKGANGKNDRVIAYGMEGIKHERNGLVVASNTMVYEHRHDRAFFVRVENPPAEFKPVIRNNLCVGKIQLTNSSAADSAGNLLLKTIEEAGFAAPRQCDYHLTPASPAIDKAAPATPDLTPASQYLHPARSEKRNPAGPLDAGAFEFQREKRG